MSGSSRIVVAAIVVAAVAGAWWYYSHGPSGGPAAPASEANLNSGTPYDQIAKLPDWSGAWLADDQPSILQTDAAIPFAPKYADKLTELRAAVKAGGPLPGKPRCRPYGTPSIMSPHNGSLYEVLYS